MRVSCHATACPAIHLLTCFNKIRKNKQQLFSKLLYCISFKQLAQWQSKVKKSKRSYKISIDVIKIHNKSDTLLIEIDRLSKHAFFLESPISSTLFHILNQEEYYLIKDITKKLSSHKNMLYQTFLHFQGFYLYVCRTK